MSNYINITDCVGGKDRGWKINQMTIELWSKKTSFESENSSSIYAAVYAGLVSNCYVKGEESDFTFEDVCDWVDKVSLSGTREDVFLLIKNTFEESDVYIKILEKLNSQLKSLSGVKKKTTKKK